MWKECSCHEKDQEKGSGTFFHSALDSGFSPLHYVSLGPLLLFLGKFLIFRKKNTYLMFKKKRSRDFPGGPVVKTPLFHCRGHGFDPWLGI